MRPVEDIERELATVKAERDALARHVEVLAAPATEAEVRAAWKAMQPYDPNAKGWENGVEFASVLVAERQRKAQFAALS